MIDGKVLLIALMALCGVNLALIWQVSTLADRVDDLDDDMRATARWLAHMETSRFWIAERHEEQENGSDDGSED